MASQVLTKIIHKEFQTIQREAGNFERLRKLSDNHPVVLVVGRKQEGITIADVLSNSVTQGICYIGTLGRLLHFGPSTLNVDIEYPIDVLYSFNNVGKDILHFPLFLSPPLDHGFQDGISLGVIPGRSEVYSGPYECRVALMYHEGRIGAPKGSLIHVFDVYNKKLSKK